MVLSGILRDAWFCKLKNVKQMNDKESLGDMRLARIGFHPPIEYVVYSSVIQNLDIYQYHYVSFTNRVYV